MSKVLEDKLIEMSKIADKQQEEIERLKNIIKEVREYIEKHWGSYYWTMSDSKIELLEILDKEKV